MNSTGKVSVKFVLARPSERLGTFRVCETPLRQALDHRAPTLTLSAGEFPLFVSVRE